LATNVFHVSVTTKWKVKKGSHAPLCFNTRHRNKGYKACPGVTCAPVVAVRQNEPLLLGRQGEECAVLREHPLDELLVHAMVHSCPPPPHTHTPLCTYAGPLQCHCDNKAWHELLVYAVFHNCPHPPTHTHTPHYPPMLAFSQQGLAHAASAGMSCTVEEAAAQACLPHARCNDVLGLAQVHHADLRSAADSSTARGLCARGSLVDAASIGGQTLQADDSCKPFCAAMPDLGKNPRQPGSYVLNKMAAHASQQSAV